MTPLDPIAPTLDPTAWDAAWKAARAKAKECEGKPVDAVSATAHAAITAYLASLEQRGLKVMKVSAVAEIIRRNGADALDAARIEEIP